MAPAHVSYGPGPICHRVNMRRRQDRDQTTQSKPYSEDWLYLVADWVVVLALLYLWLAFHGCHWRRLAGG